MAQNFMSVAGHFGPKTAIITDLTIQPTAAYLLAGPSVPDEARQRAVKRAEAGEKITAAVAKEILVETRKKRPRAREKAVPGEKLYGELIKVLQHFRDRWDTKDLKRLARQLRDFADTLDVPKGGRGAKKE